MGPIQSSKGSCILNPEIECSIGDMVVGSEVTVSIPVTPTIHGPFTNQVAIRSNTTDLENGNNSDSVLTTVQPLSDLSVSQTVSANTIYSQEPLTYTITVTNHGPSVATNVVLEDVLSSLVDFVSAPAGCAFTDPEIICDLGDLPVDETRSLTISTRTIKSKPGGTITNTVTVNSDPWDPVALDNTSMITTNFLEDTTAPTITWVTPVTAEQIFLIGDTVDGLVYTATLKVNASDQHNDGSAGEIDYIKFYNREVWSTGTNLDDVWWDVAILQDAPYEYTIDAFTLGDFWNQMNAEAYDMAGNRAPVTSVYYIWLYYTPIEEVTKIFFPFILK
jgi:uncharacterized repeat protein (TIGR01451 family)